MIYIDIEEYVKTFAKLPNGYQLWEFRSLPGDPPFFFTCRNKYGLAKKQATSKYRLQHKTEVGIIEVVPKASRASL